MPLVDSETKIRLYRKMMEIRCFEEASLPYFRKPGHGSHHPCIGHEGVEAAIGAILNQEDYLFGSHRSHGILLSRGLDPRLMMAELWGKTSGYCQGRGGSMHITDVSKRTMVSGMVGTSITLAVGAALAMKLRGEKGIAIASFGDGAANCGAFHEGLNMAAIWHLPAVFVCENNGLAVTTHLRDSTSIMRLSDRASAYSMPGREVDGTDPVESCAVLSEAAQRARVDGSPSLICATVPRWRGHSAWEDGSYLTQEELQEMQDRDPLPKYRRRLLEEGLLTLDKVDSIDAELRSNMEEAVRFAEESVSPPATKEEAGKYVFAEMG